MTLRRRCASARGMTLIELLVVIVVIGILLILAVAVLTRARLSGNESAAIGALRTINTAQFAYLNGCGQGHYATSLVILGQPGGGRAQGYLSDDLGASVTPQRNGYRFNVQQGADAEPSRADCNGQATQTTYYATAIPVALGNTGARSFATNQHGAIWGQAGGAPPTEPFGPPAVPAQ